MVSTNQHGGEGAGGGGGGGDASSSGGWAGSGSDAMGGYRRDRYLRVRITDSKTSLVKLETRIPAGFIDPLTAMIPQVRAHPKHLWCSYRLQ